MATVYTQADNAIWKLVGTGPMDIQVQSGPQCLVHFGVLLVPADYDYPHMHLGICDKPYRYTGIEEVWVRVANSNVAGITSRAKFVSNPVTV